MIIVKDTAKGIPLKKVLAALGLTLFGATLAYFIYTYDGRSKGIPSLNVTGSEVYCDAEFIEKHEGATKFLCNGDYFLNGITQSSERAYSGQYSSKVGGGNRKFGITYKMKDVVPGGTYIVSVLRNKENAKSGFLVIDANEVKNQLIVKKNKALPFDGEWEIIYISLHIPENVKKGKEISVHVSSIDGKAVFFDDLRISRIDQGELAFKPSALNLRTDEKGLNKITKLRKEALEAGILINSDDPWVDGDILEENNKISVKFRLKGDWLDHLSGEKWSFRIKTDPLEAWNRLKVFSVHTPAARNFLNEWVFHKLLEREDVLTTRYEFINLIFNGKDLRTYACEEHFEKQLLEYKKRREGPILRFTEDSFWESRVKSKERTGDLQLTEQYMHHLESTQIEPFDDKGIMENPVLKEQFQIAQNLLEQYRLGTASISKIFDVEMFAKFLAIVDVSNAYHGLIWHNMRFYYNPITSRLEPIGFDGNPGEQRFINTPFLGYKMYSPDATPPREHFKEAFKDTTFYKAYIKNLAIFTGEAYLGNFFADHIIDIASREAFLQKEFPDYSFDAGYFISNANKINLLIYPLNDRSVKVFTREISSNGKKILDLVNYHHLPIQVVGFGQNNESWTVTDSKQWVNTQLPDRAPEYFEYDAPSSTRYVFYSIPGIDSVFYSEIKPWPAPNDNVPRQGQTMNIKKLKTATVVGNKIIFEAGKHIIDEDLTIPDGYSVRFEAGSILDILDSASFFSFSPIEMMGNLNAPITVISSDSSAKGFTVMQAESLSKLSHVEFKWLNTFSKSGWSLTGAVTFYESDVTIDHCTFGNNYCEDALNIIRSDFEIKNSVIINTFADALDADFCTGTVSSCTFENLGNDALDVSGTDLVVENCTVTNPGDKGVSVGEESKAQIKSINITGAHIGLASKDLSRVKVNHIEFNNCNQAFVLFMKKVEYGPAFIEVDDYEVNNVQRLHLVEKGSTLILNGVKVEGI